MVWAESIDKYWTDEATGDRYAKISMFADNTPSPFPTDASEIERLSDKAPYDTTGLKVGAGSTVYVINDATVFMYKSDGTVVEQ